MSITVLIPNTRCFHNGLQKFGEQPRGGGKPDVIEFVAAVEEESHQRS